MACLIYQRCRSMGSSQKILASSFKYGLTQCNFSINELMSSRNLSTPRSSALCMSLPNNLRFAQHADFGSESPVCLQLGVVPAIHSYSLLHTSIPATKNDRIKINVQTDSETVTLECKEGDTLLDVINDNNYEIEGYGACEGTIACSTCHVVLSQQDYDTVSSVVTEEEQDMLDMVTAVTKTGGLTCLSLAGCGFLAPYLLGAVTCLAHHHHHHLQHDVGGYHDLNFEGYQHRPCAYHLQDRGYQHWPSLGSQRLPQTDLYNHELYNLSVSQLNFGERQQHVFEKQQFLLNLNQNGACHVANTRTVKEFENESVAVYARNKQSQANTFDFNAVSFEASRQFPPYYVAGASAGALLGAVLLAGQPPLQVLWETLSEAANDCSAFVFGAFSSKILLEKYIRKVLEQMPHDAHNKLSGRLFVSMTHAESRKNHVVNQWDSREELIQSLLCSSYIPMVSGGEVPLFRGERYIDGGFSNNQPKPFEDCLSISAYASLADICPRDAAANTLPRYLKVANSSMELSMENVGRYYRSVIPCAGPALAVLYRDGYLHTQTYLNEGLVLRRAAAS